MQKLALHQTDEIGNLIHRIGSDWMLLTAGTPEQLGTMTASWGSIGMLWNQPMATIFVRRERHTYGFIETENRFSIAFFSPEWREALTFCGKNSGRDVDKCKTCDFTVATGSEGGVYFKEADLVLICEKRYREELSFDKMQGFDPTPYYNDKKGGLHTMYMGEIVEVYAKERD